ncbi:MAG: DinB family protein [Bacillota bacterium]
MSDLLSPSRLLEIMESNRRLTLRTIEAFPEDALFRYKPAEHLRPFAEMVKEILHLELAYVRGVATGEWVHEQPYQVVQTKEELLRACGAVREYSLAKWHKVTAERLQAVEPDPFFGGGEGSLFDRLFYAIENEIHHRGQGFAYLRMLSIEPPFFWER